MQWKQTIADPPPPPPVYFCIRKRKTSVWRRCLPETRCSWEAYSSAQLGFGNLDEAVACFVLCSSRQITAPWQMSDVHARWNIPSWRCFWVISSKARDHPAAIAQPRPTMHCAHVLVFPRIWTFLPQGQKIGTSLANTLAGDYQKTKTKQKPARLTLPLISPRNLIVPWRRSEIWLGHF